MNRVLKNIAAGNFCNTKRLELDAPLHNRATMSKRNNEGDVIANRISLLEAKGQKLLASLYGSRPDWGTADGDAKTQVEDDDQDLKQNYAHDR